ncbi:hypothetical protein D3C76_1443330 [compost metagenome]
MADAFQHLLRFVRFRFLDQLGDGCLGPCQGVIPDSPQEIVLVGIVRIEGRPVEICLFA